MHGQLLGTTVADNLEVALRDELDKRLEMELWDNTLLDGLEDDYLTTLKQDEQRYEDSHFVSNEEADEDASHMLTSFPISDPFTSEYKVVKERFNGVSQFILDFVEANDVVSFTEMNDMYKAYTKGSNSFSHILKALQIPYKNRPTQRYLAKTIDGKYRVRIAGIHNWVVVND
jgi:hypothetical protein